MAVTFTHPQFLFLLVFVPLLIVLHFFLLRMKRSDAVKFSNFEAIARIRGVDLYSKNIVIVGITGLISLLIIFSLAGLNVDREISSSAQSFVIAIDVSQSMEANDIPPSRIDAAISAASSFVDSSPPGTRIAILSYSGNAFIEQEITSEKGSIKNGLNNVQLSAIGGTDPAEAIISSTNVLANEDGKAIILISDGRINVGNIDDALEYAIRNGVIIHTIGIGTETGGQTSFGLSTIEEDSLKSTAYGTGGQYFRVDSLQSLEQSFDSILEFKIKRVFFDISRPILVIALVLVIMQYILINTRYRTYP